MALSRDIKRVTFSITRWEEGLTKKESAAIGAFSGLSSGLTSALGSTNTVYNAGKETVDRCMRTRGYKVY